MIDSIKDPDNEEAKKQMCAASAFAGQFARAETDYPWIKTLYCEVIFWIFFLFLEFLKYGTRNSYF